MEQPLGKKIVGNRSMETSALRQLGVDPAAVITHLPLVEPLLRKATISVDPRAKLQAFPKPGPRGSGGNHK